MKELTFCLAFVFGWISNVYSYESKPDWNDPSNIRWAIEQNDDVIIIQAGNLRKTIRLDDINISTVSLMIGKHEIIEKAYPEVSLALSRSKDNREPEQIKVFIPESTIESTATFGLTDDLLLNQSEAAPVRKTEWLNAVILNSLNWDREFDRTIKILSYPCEGVQRLVIRSRAIQKPGLKDVSVSIFYEIYEGHSAIRQWVEVVNNSPNWLRLDKLILSPLPVGKVLQNVQPLTPDDKAAPASIRTFSSSDESFGLILGSEIPSATRRLDIDTGIMGYSDQFFEWILKPAGSFKSEPVSYYSFEGKVFKTVSAVSKPLDRCVESRYQDYLSDCIGAMVDEAEFFAPRYATWSNYAQYITEDICRKIIPIAARCGFELFQIDDGWQTDRLGTEPHPDKFPNFDSLCELVRDEGMTLGLWVSCYRSLNSKDIRVLPNSLVLPPLKRLDGYGMGYASDWRDYYAQDIVYLNDRYGAKYFKQDFTNIRLGDLASGHENRSIKESYLKGLRGFLESQRMIREMSPDISTLITHEIYWGTPGVPCDLAAMKYGCFYHIPPNDYSGLGPIKYRKTLVAEYDSLADRKQVTKDLLRGCWNARQRYYEHRGLPMHMIEYYGAATANVQNALTPDIQDRQICSFLMGAPVVYAGDLLSLTEDNISHYAKRFRLLKELQEKYNIYSYFQFSGVPQPSEEDWHWWGKINENSEGVVVVIRGSEGSDQREINIPWLAPDKKYIVTQLFADKDLGVFKGEDLQEGIIKISLSPYGQDILLLNELN